MSITNFKSKCYSLFKLSPTCSTFPQAGYQSFLDLLTFLAQQIVARFTSIAAMSEFEEVVL